MDKQHVHLTPEQARQRRRDLESSAKAEAERNSRIRNVAFGLLVVLILLIVAFFVFR